MTNFQRGDRVRITTKNSQYSGKEALVIHVHNDRTVLVNIDGNQSLSGFFESELEPLFIGSIVRLEVNLSSVEEDYDVAVNLTPEEARGVGKFVAAAKEAEQAKGIQFGPKLGFKSNPWKPLGTVAEDGLK